MVVEPNIFQMKKLLVLAVMLTMFATAQAQFKVGPHIAFPVGTAADIYTLVWGADAYYMFGNPDAFVNLGVASGFLNFVGDEFESGGQTFDFDNAQFIPVAAAGRIVILSTLSAGADVGYGLGLNSDIDGGFYWRLNAGIDLGNVIELNAFYYSIDSDWNAFGLNLLFEFGGKK